MTGGARLTIGGLRWTLTALGRQLLSDPDLDLGAHQAAGRLAVVKHGQHRSVYRVSLPNGETVYWKHCRLNGPRAWWRDFFRGPKAQLEFDRVRALAQRGAATIEPLAWGRFPGQWPQGSFLVTRALDEAVPLDHYLVRHPLTPAGRYRLTTALAEYVARLHTAGVTHPDLHPGNLLVRDAPHDPTFYLIDVHDLELGDPLGPAARVRNLTLLNRWFQLRATRADRLRFWKAYAGAAADPGTARRIERETHRSVVGLWRSHYGRCMRENRHFYRLAGPGTDGFAVRDLNDEAASLFVLDPDAPFATTDGDVLKESRSATVARLAIVTAAGPRPMVYKQFRVTHRTDYLAAWFRPPPALRSWSNGHALIDRGLPTPRPWLVLHRRRFGLPGVGYLLCDLVPGASHLHDAARTATAGDKRRLIDTLARWVQLMHDRGVSHRDLKAANILVTADGGCQFVDLVGVRARGQVAAAVRVRDLARLNASFVNSPHVSRTDRLRFLRTYLVWGLRGSAGWRNWWDRVGAATEDKVRRNERRKRPLA